MCTFSIATRTRCFVARPKMLWIKKSSLSRTLWLKAGPDHWQNSYFSRCSDFLGPTFEFKFERCFQFGEKALSSSPPTEVAFTKRSISDVPSLQSTARFSTTRNETSAQNFRYGREDKWDQGTSLLDWTHLEFFGLCTGRSYDCHVGSVLLSWMRSVLAPVTSTVRLKKGKWTHTSAIPNSVKF